MARLSLGSALRWWAEKEGDRPALSCEGVTLTRRELEDRTNRLARAFSRMGVTKKDFVAISLPNGIQFFETVLAGVKLGAVVVPLSPRLPEQERTPIFDLVKPTLIVGLSAGIYGSVPVVPQGYVCPDDLPCDPLPEVDPYPWSATASGGSTGRPKIIVNTRPPLIDPQVPEVKLALGCAVLVPAPLYHGSPFHNGLRALSTGDHVIVMPKFDPEACLEMIQAYQIDYMQLVPTMMNRMWRLGPDVLRRYDLSSLRVLVSFGGACPAWLKENWITLLGPEKIHEFYTCTEQLGKTWIDCTEWLQHRGSVGRPINGSRIKVFGPEGQELPPREIGEIYMIPATGPGTSYYYIGADSTRRRDGWESCGDLGWFDEDGYLYIADRRTDMIVSGGANVYPAEVEAALENFPAVRASAVIGLPDDDLGHRVHAVIETDQAIDVEQLRAWLAERLSRSKIPRTFEFVKEPIRDESGKVRRSALRLARTGGAFSKDQEIH